MKKKSCRLEVERLMRESDKYFNLFKIICESRVDEMFTDGTKELEEKKTLLT